MRRSVLFHDAWFVFWREMKRLGRQKARIAVALVQPAIWLGLMGSTMNQATSTMPQVTAVMGAPDYFAYMTPGVIVMTTLFGAIYAGMSVIWDRRLGVMDRMLASPVARPAIPLGKAAAATAMNVVQAAAVLLTARAFGVVIATGFAGAVVVVAVASIASLGLSAASLALATRIRSFETLLAVAGFLTMPLVFSSTVLFPTLFMPGWLAEATKWNPLTFVVSPLRNLVNKGWYLDDILSDTAVVAAVACFFMLIVARQFRRLGR